MPIGQVVKASYHGSGVRRQASEAESVSSEMQSLEYELESLRNDYESCRQFPETFDFMDDDCESQRSEVNYKVDEYNSSEATPQTDEP